MRDDHTNRYGNVTRLTRSVLAEPIFVGPER